MPVSVVGCRHQHHNHPNASMPNLCQHLLLAVTATITTTLMRVCQFYASIRRRLPPLLMLVCRIYASACCRQSDSHHYHHNHPNASMPNLCQYPSPAATTPNASMPNLCQRLLLAVTTATKTTLMLVCQIYASICGRLPPPTPQPP